MRPRTFPEDHEIVSFRASDLPFQLTLRADGRPAHGHPAGSVDHVQLGHAARFVEVRLDGAQRPVLHADTADGVPSIEKTDPADGSLTQLAVHVVDGGQWRRGRHLTIIA